MQQTQQTQIDEGTTLVNDSGRCVTVTDMQDGTVVCDDSNFRREQEYDRDELATAVNDGHFRIVENSELTTIKGIGKKTAPRIEAKTDCRTPSELVEAYLTDSDGTIRETIPRTDYFTDWLQSNVEELDIDVTKAQLRVMLFLKEVGCNAKSSDVQNVDDIGTNRTGGIKSDKLSLEHIDWNDGELWVDSANVACVARGIDGLTNLLSREMWNPTKPCDSHESDGDHHRFIVDGAETWVSGDYLDTIQTVFDANLNDVHCHPDGEHPVYVRDAETSLVVAIAPRIQ